MTEKIDSFFNVTVQLPSNNKVFATVDSHPQAYRLHRTPTTMRLLAAMLRTLADEVESDADNLKSTPMGYARYELEATQ